MLYAGIGSRKTPLRTRAIMERYAKAAAMNKYILRSGGAAGADTAFEVGATRSKGLMEIFRPVDAAAQSWALATVDMYHPSPKALSHYARLLMARNAMIVLGRDKAFPVRQIICWTEGAQGGGGTGQALRIAQDYAIPIFDLADSRVEKYIVERTKQLMRCANA